MTTLRSNQLPAPAALLSSAASARRCRPTSISNNPCETPACRRRGLLNRQFHRSSCPTISPSPFFRNNFRSGTCCSSIEFAASMAFSCSAGVAVPEHELLANSFCLLPMCSNRRETDMSYIASSTVSLIKYMYTVVGRCCPIRCTRAIA